MGQEAWGSRLHCTATHFSKMCSSPHLSESYRISRVGMGPQGSLSPAPSWTTKDHSKSKPYVAPCIAHSNISIFFLRWKGSSKQSLLLSVEEEWMQLMLCSSCIPPPAGRLLGAHTSKCVSRRPWSLLVPACWLLYISDKSM